MPDAGLGPARHETRDFDERLIWIGMPVLIAAVVALTLLVVLLFPRSMTDKTITLPLPQYPGPRLQSDPARDMRSFHEQEMRALNGIGWIDRTHGVTHIPISEAMGLVVREGIPGWPTPAEPPR